MNPKLTLEMGIIVVSRVPLTGVPTTVFTQLYGVIDSYSNNLKLGNTTIEDLNNLTNRLTELSTMLSELK